ncbi:hypothetical protein V8C35DRAFT_168168 [Trichoderma chlorosporum]
MPYILSRGIDVLHCAFHADRGSARLARLSHKLRLRRTANSVNSCAVAELQALARLQPAHGFGMVLSRGFKDNWARKQPKEFHQYSPFWGFRDKGGYISWCNNEDVILFELGLDSTFPVFFELLSRVESVQDAETWSIGLWDPDRYLLDAEYSDPSYPKCMLRRRRPPGVEAQWDAFLVGWASAVRPEMMDGGIGERGRIRSALKTISEVLKEKLRELRWELVI